MTSGSMYYQYVYAIVPSECDYIKIDRWSGTIADLHSQHAAYYEEFEMWVFQTLDSKDGKEKAFRYCSDQLIRNELFKASALPLFLQFGSIYAETTCQSEDLDDSLRRSVVLRIRQLEEDLKKIADDRAAEAE